MTQEENSSLPSPAPQNGPTTERPKRKSRKQSDHVPDIFDEQAALREQERQAAAQAENAKPVRQDEGNHVERLKFPEPFGVQNIALTGEKNGPRMHLARSSRYRQMRIAFDEKPAEETLQLLRDNGFRWNNEHKAWTLQLERGAEWRAHADAERLFKEIANGIRECNGLEPVGQSMAAGM